MHRIQYDAPDRFVMMTLAGNAQLLGGICQKDLAAWKENTTRAISVKEPKRYIEMPVQDPTNPNNVKVNLVVRSWSMTKTKQEELFVCPIAIEVLADLDTNYFYGTEAHKMFDTYMNSIQEWNAMQAGILAPTANDMAKVRNIDALRPVR